MGSIAFVGDSFCASYGAQDWKQRGCTLNQFGTDKITYIDRVVRANNYTLYPFGFGGKSWWYSRCRFNEELERVPRNIFRNDLEVIVFCHTNPGRINNAWNVELSNTDTRSAEARSYYRHIFDDRFNAWAQQQWFKEIAQDWSSVKTIHFHVYPETVKWSDLLPGVVFTTPLIHISIGELEGDDRDIDQQLMDDERHNHLSEHNNKILGDIVLETIYRYESLPRRVPINLSRFRLVNPNSTRFPEKNYGSI